MYDLVCVGDTTLDTFLKVHDAAVHCNLKGRECELCFRYGEKIPVDELVQNPGGNAANVAVGSATLGVKTALYAIVGEDDIGDKVRRLIGKRKVDTKYLFTNKGKPTNYSTIISFRGERTILEMKYPAKLSFTRFPKTKWVYVTSVKQDPKTVYEPLVKLKKKLGFKIAFNPGMFQLTYTSNDLVKFLPFVDVLIVNKEEAGMMIKKLQVKGCGLQDMIKGLYRIVEEGGYVFVTDGERGAWGYDGRQFVHYKKFPAKEVVDRTGAGDAFSTGIVAGLIKGEKYPNVILWGMANSVAVLSKIGPQNGVLNAVSMKKILAKTLVAPKTLSRKNS